MPCTGGRHAVNCLHYEAPAEPSGSADIGTAISEDPDTGLTKLDVDFSLSSELSKPRSHRAEPEASNVHSISSRLSLRGLLQFLWNEAELTTWKPAFTGKRTWAVVRHHLLHAAANKLLEGQPLPNVMFVPESFTVSQKEQIAARRARRLADGLRRPDDGQRKMIVIGEVKEILHAQNAFNIVLKHLPDLPFYVEADTHRRMIRNFADELSLWGSAADVHLMIVATFTLSAGKHPYIDEIGLVPTSGQWIPADDAFELRLVNGLVSEGRSFRKSLRLNAKVPSRSSSAMILDVKGAALGLGLDRYSKDGVDAATAAESGSTPEWLWRIREEDLPAFPR